MTQPPIVFEFSRLPLDSEPPHRFDLGDLTLAIGAEQITSRGPTKRLAMMIYPSISELMSGIVSIMTGETRAYHFVGIDSSLQIDLFEQRGKIRVMQGRRLVGIATFAETARALSEAVQNFLADGNELDPDDAIRADIAAAQSDLCAALKSLSTP
jgi:hypothetical protein